MNLYIKYWPDTTHIDMIQVELSRRNLQALLAKLDGHPANSSCMLYKDFDAEGPNIRLLVKAVENDEAYHDRAPGPLHVDTQIILDTPA